MRLPARRGVECRESNSPKCRHDDGSATKGLSQKFHKEEAILPRTQMMAPGVQVVLQRSRESITR